MSPEEQAIPNDDARKWPTFDAVYESIIELMDQFQCEKRFPKQKLKNRLINLGLKEFLDGTPHETDSRALEIYGFPFRFVSQLDEATLVLAHYLNRFREYGGTLRVYGLNKLSKGEDKNLSYWQSAKAKLYLELQNLILLFNGAQDKKSGVTWNSQVTRIFTFRDLSDLAFLNQSAISVLSEQLASKIQIGFLFMESFRKEPLIEPISNTLLVEYLPPESSDERSRHNFYELHAILDPTKLHELPYQDRCASKWFRDRDEAKRVMPRITPLLSLFESKWQTFDDKIHDGITKFQKVGTEFFNAAGVMMYRGLTESSDFPKGNDPRVPEILTTFADRVNESVMTPDFLRLERAISAFDASDKIIAVDATSVKNSLKLHEADPTYRRWIRKSLNNVTRPGSQKTLCRTYILKDSGRNAGLEFEALSRTLQYYLDYFHLNISEVTSIVNVHENSEHRTEPQTRQWLEGLWESVSDRVTVRITTSSILEDFTDKVLDATKGLNGLNQISSDTPRILENAHESLAKLDFLLTESMIYNFTTERADPAELRFDAYLYRRDMNVGDKPELLPRSPTEQTILFDFTGNDTTLLPLKTLQTNHRLNSLARSILRYREKYPHLLSSEAETEIQQIFGTLDKRNFGQDKIDTFLKIRRDFEAKLYKHFWPIFTYLFEVLSYLSVEVDFFSDHGEVKALQRTSIQDVPPFCDCNDVTSFTEFLRKNVQRKLDDGVGIPQFQSYLEDEHLPAEPEIITVKTQPQIFLSYAREDKSQVDKLYEELSKAGYAAWQDTRRIVIGVPLKKTIRKAIKESDFFMPCLSINSCDKEGFIQREIKQALDIWQEKNSNTVYILPVRLDKDAKVPEEFEDLAYINLFEPDGMSRLIEDLQRIIEGKTS